MKGRCWRIVQSPCFPIVLLNFMACCSMVGLVKAMGVLFGDVSKSIPMNSTDFGTTLGLFFAGGIFISPIAAGIYSRISRPRLLLLFCTTMGNSAIVMSSLATSKMQLSIAFAISGTGYSLVIIICATELGRFAGENFNVLYSLTTCGNSVGMVLLPLLAEELLDAYGWRGVLLILSGLLSNAIPCAMAIRISTEDIQATDDMRLKKINPTENVTKSVVPEEVSGAESENHFNYPSDVTPGSVEDGGIKDDDREPLLTLPKEHDMTTDDSDQPLGSLTNPLAYKNYLDYIIDFPGKISLWFQSTELYTDPISTFLYLSDGVLYFVYTGWHAFLIPHAFERGISERNAIIMAFVAALGNLSIRPTVAFLTNKLVDPVSMHLALTIFNIMSLACDAYIHNYYVMLVTSFCSAAAIAGRAVLAPLAIRARVSANNFAVAIVVNFILADCGILLGGYLSGLIADSFSSYNATFKFLAVIDLFTFIFMLLPKLVKKPKLP